MFVTRFTYSPALGKTQEVASALSSRVKELSAQGARIGLLRRLFGPGGPEFQTITAHDDLGKLQETRTKMLADPATQSSMQKLEGLCRAPIVIGLYEVLVPAQRMPSGGEFLVRISQYPAAGRIGEFVESAADLTRRLQADGLVINLVTKLFSADGPELQSVLTLKTLQEWEGFVKRVRTESLIQNWVRAVAPLSRSANASEIWEVQAISS